MKRPHIKRIYDAVQYCNKLNLKDGYTPCYTVSEIMVIWNKNADGFAKIIAEKTNADIFRIERDVPYSATSKSTKLYGETLNEIRENVNPNLKTYLEDVGLNIDDYDLSGKTIIPFCSMGDGRFEQTISMVAKLTPTV